MRKTSKSIKETTQIAKIFLEKILKTKSTDSALVVGISGELGAGKTAFTQAVARHLRIKSKVNSPTFVILKKYPIKLKGYRFLFHLDAYRLKDEKELLYLGWEEIVGNKEHLVFIEWPERVTGIMPRNSSFVDISHTETGHRSFRLRLGA